MQLDDVRTLAHEMIDDLFAISVLAEMIKTGRGADADRLHDKFQTMMERCQRHSTALLVITRQKKRGEDDRNGLRSSLQ